MPIYVDSTEQRDTSVLPTITGALTCTVLEELCGADILISPLKMPPTTVVLIQKHVQAGALLIQRKSSADLVHSVGTRILHSLALMRATGAAQWQCVLLSTGIFIPNTETGNVWVGRMVEQNGQPNILWQEVKWQYRALATELRRYALRGGTYIPLTCDEEIPGWCKQAESDLLALRDEGVKKLWPDARDYPPDPPVAGDVLQELRPVTDGRIVIATLKGVGPTKANALWQGIRDYRHSLHPDENTNSWEPSLGEALLWASAQDPKLYGLPHVHGWGKGIRNGIRKQLGLEDGLDFGFTTNGLGVDKEEDTDA